MNKALQDKIEFLMNELPAIQSVDELLFTALCIYEVEVRREPLYYVHKFSYKDSFSEIQKGIANAMDHLNEIDQRWQQHNFQRPNRL